ncbi:MAG: type III secretion system outer membrane ring subunit SctC [Endozoicomonas sp.]
MGLLKPVVLFLSTVVLSLRLFTPQTVSLVLPLPVSFFAGSLFANPAFNPGQRNVRRHIVRPGESLSAIAQNYGFDVYELVQFNQLYNPNSLMAGQAIYLPGDDLSAGGVPQSRQPLNATSFPPSDAAPSQEDYYQMQQLLGGQPSAESPLPEVESVDYNYSHKVPKEATDKKKENTDPVPGDQAQDDSKTNKTADADENVSAEIAEADPEENIDDSSSPALSAFGERPYAYYGSGESLVDVLQNFAASYYVPTIFAEDVLGEVNGKIGPLTPVEFLDHMANVYGFIWYFDGHSLYVYNGNASQQQIISLGFMTTDNFKKTLKKVGIWDGRFFWKAQPKEGLIYISGPPRYVEMVTQTAMLLDDKEGERQKSQLSVRMFRLKYAWATDKSFSFRGQELVVPGVSSLLRSIVSGGGVASVIRKDIPSPTLQPARSVTRSGEKPKADKPANPLNNGADAESVYISADPRLNAIIVHDLESKMPMYEELIKSLDKPSSQVEVSVSIIDVNSEDISRLGVDWNNTRTNTNNNSTVSEIKFDPASSSHKDDFSPFTTVVGLNIGSFNARLSALADDGRAKIVSRPSILTLDNLEAVFDNSSTFYVEVASNEDAELFPVTSGTIVQVTPRIVNENDGRRIHMSVNIQDGGDAQEEGLSLPRVSNSSISTQAMVNENESLLIGGFFKEIEQEKQTKVPVLGDLPVFGALFRTESTRNSRQVRLFLITPRILSAGA